MRRGWLGAPLDRRNEGARGLSEDAASREGLERIAASLERPPLSGAVAALRRGRPGEAEAIVGRFLAERPGEPGALWLLASALGVAGRAEEAEPPLRGAAGRAPPVG